MLVVIAVVLRLREAGEHAADLAGGEGDQLALVIMPLRHPGNLSTAAGAPFERR